MASYIFGSRHLSVGPMNIIADLAARPAKSSTSECLETRVSFVAFEAVESPLLARALKSDVEFR
jgi:hypothetical protein